MAFTLTAKIVPGLQDEKVIEIAILLRIVSGLLNGD